MSARPVVGGIYAHPRYGRSSVLVRVICANDESVVVRPVIGLRRLPTEVTRQHFDRCFVQMLPPVEETTGDDLMLLAEAVGVVAEEIRPRGAQPVSEFSAGPEGFGPLWDDARLHAELDALEGGGGR